MPVAKKRRKTEPLSTEMEAISKQLHDNSTVQLKIGTGNPTFHISKAILGNISRELSAAIKVKGLYHVQFASRLDLSLPDDDYQAWEVLLYWVAKRCLPKEAIDSQLVLVRSWALGEKYKIVEFQDEVMLALLIKCDGEERTHIDTIKAAFANTEPDSELNYLMAEELLYNLGQHDGKEGAIADDDLEGIVEDFAQAQSLEAFATTYLKATKMCAIDGRDWCTRFKRKEGHQYGRWKTFMVGNASRVHGQATAQEAFSHQREEGGEQNQ